ncbi:MAG: hypothetical protein ABJP48_03560 [Erythrobacter sp.]
MSSHLQPPCDDHKNDCASVSLSDEASVQGTGAHSLVAQSSTQPANDNDEQAAGHKLDDQSSVPSLYSALGYQRSCPYQWWVE